MSDDEAFSRLVSLACHDIRTPLATVQGFARTLERLGELGPPADRYVELIVQGSVQMVELLDQLALLARIEGGRYEPVLELRSTFELVRAAVALLDQEAEITGEGAEVKVDVEATERALAALARCAARHGGVERVTLDARGAEIGITPITGTAAPIVLGDDLKDLGAASAVRLVSALGGSVVLEGERLAVGLPS
jgi:signal transduction histidine kinase